MLLGALFTPCNIYSGLKIGWSFNMSIAAGLLGFGLWRIAEGVTGTRRWGIYENNLNQTTASSASSIISGGLVAPIPALTMLTGETFPWHVLAFWLFVVSALGTVVASSIRTQLVVREKLRFPAGIAIAETLQQIHAKGMEATGRLKVLLYSTAVSAAAKLIDGLVYALPRLTLPVKALPIGLPAGATASTIAISPANLGFALEPSLLMLGFGAIIGIRIGISLLLGALLGWGALAPFVLAQGWAAPGPSDPQVSWFGPLVEWLLWPGVVLMVVGALTALAVSLCRIYLRRWREGRRAGPRILPPRAFFAGAVAALVLAVSAQVGLFGIAIWQAVLAVALSFLLAVVAARVMGETGITPIGAMGQITQLIYGGLIPGDLTANLMTANVTGGASGQCADLMDDLKTGHIIGATPALQVVAQIFGVLTGSLVGSLVYLMLVPNPSAMLITAEWPAPAVATWKAVAEVMTQGVSAIPAGALPSMVIAGVVGFILAVAEKTLPERVVPFVPSGPALGLALVIPASNSISLFLGSAGAAVLQKVAPRWAERRLIALAAGLVAGESLAGVAIIAFALAG